MNGWLIDTLIYTGLLIGAVLVLRRPAGRVFGPQIAYALWALPFIRLLLPPIVLPAKFAPEAAAAATAAPEAVQVNLQWAEAAQPASVQAAQVAAFTPADAAPVAASASAWDWALFGEIALSVWAGGALAFLAWRVFTYRRMRDELLAEARPVGETGKVRLVETPALAAPVAFGVLDKVVALPPLFMAQPDLVARDLAIEHELAHHRGHDLLANFAAQALLALHWFNPLAWYGWRAMRRDQEAACDARVLAGRGRDERIRYAALIAGAAAGPRLALAAPMACPLLGERSIVHRLRSLARSDLSTRRRWLGRALVAAGAFALPLTASISYSAAAQQRDEELPAPPAVQVVAVGADTSAGAPKTERVDIDAASAEPAADPSEGDDDGDTVARRFTLRPAGPWPTPNPIPMPVMPRVTVVAWGDSADPDFDAKMEKWADDMAEWGEKWGEAYGQQWEDWAEQREQAVAAAERQREQALDRAGRQREQALAQVERQREQALAMAERQREQALAIAERQREIQRVSRSSLRGVRASIAANPDISEEVRDEVLRDLDKEIARIERDEG